MRDSEKDRESKKAMEGKRLLRKPIHLDNFRVIHHANPPLAFTLILLEVKFLYFISIRFHRVSLGKVIIFYSLLASGETDDLRWASFFLWCSQIVTYSLSSSLHAGCPPIGDDDTKWSANKWVRQLFATF